MEFAFLGDRPEFIPLIAKWYFDEWGHKIPGISIEKTIEKVSTMLNREKIPLHLLALEGNEILAVAQLKIREMSIYPEKEHWLGGVYVTPRARSKGLATKLVMKAVELAKQFGVVTLYLQTEQLDGGLYARLGWKAIEKTHYNGFEVLVMERRV